MYPLHGIDTSSMSLSELVQPYWNDLNGMGMKIYLSTLPQFHMDFLFDEFDEKTGGMIHESESKRTNHDTVLLWEESSISTSTLSLKKSFILTHGQKQNNQNSTSFEQAVNWLQDAEEKEAALNGQSGVKAVLSSATAGDSIQSTSVLLTLYQKAEDFLSKAWKYISEGGSSEAIKSDEGHELSYEEFPRVIVPIVKNSSIWKMVLNNSTAYVHVVLTRNSKLKHDSSFDITSKSFKRLAQSHNILFGNVNLVKHDLPSHISKPKRFLYRDILYIIRRLLRITKEDEVEPWNMSITKATDHQLYEKSLKMKEEKRGYPYWKPEVAIKFVTDDQNYPVTHAGISGMDIIHTPRSRSHPSDMAYLPGMFVDEIGLTSDKYIPLNRTIDALPLRITFDRNSDNIDTDEEKNTNDNGLSPARWRLLRHLSSTLENQKQMGFEESDVDDVRRLIAETNVTLLTVTILASVFHLLFEFLTFKNEVEFWKGNKDLTGLSVRALFMDFFSQCIILLFLIERDSSLLMTIPSAVGCLIAFWKCHRGAGFKFVRIDKDEPTTTPIRSWNKLFRLIGYEFQATRLRAASQAATASKKSNGTVNMAALSEEMDQLATQIIGKFFLLPLIVSYTIYTLVSEEYPGWYSWMITSASSGVYGIGFVMMTPQLFLNYKLKSVAHLPWKVLCYRFLNTFIDDLFAFIIRMPTMARISCFRDDIVFMIYLWQRYLYPVDVSRPAEGGGMDHLSAAAAVESNESEKKSKSKPSKDIQKKKNQ